MCFSAYPRFALSDCVFPSLEKNMFSLKPVSHFVHLMFIPFSLEAELLGQALAARLSSCGFSGATHYIAIRKDIRPYYQLCCSSRFEAPGERRHPSCADERKRGGVTSSVALLQSTGHVTCGCEACLTGNSVLFDQTAEPTMSQKALREFSVASNRPWNKKRLSCRAAIGVLV